MYCLLEEFSGEEKKGKEEEKASLLRSLHFSGKHFVLQKILICSLFNTEVRKSARDLEKSIHIGNEIIKTLFYS